MEARRWLQGVDFPDRRPLLNLSQAAPVDPPPEELRAHMAEVIRTEPDTHLYGPVLGLPALRSEIAWRSSALYGGEIRPDEVAVTAGCNQAFCAAIMTLAAPGDAVLLPVPWYFNHKMWLDMTGIEAIPLPCGPGMLPDPHAARARMSPRVRAIVLVTPNNPTGAEYPPELIAEFAAIARDARRRPHPRRDLPRLRQPATPAPTTSSPTPPGATPSSSSTPSPSPSTSPATAPAPSSPAPPASPRPKKSSTA